MFCLNMLRIALELAREDHIYEDIAIKFGEHFLLIGGAMTNLGGEGCGLWDDQDNFYYDWLFLSSGEKVPLRLRSIVGLIPLFAVEVLDEDLLKGATGVYPAHEVVSPASSAARETGDPPGKARRRKQTADRRLPVPSA